MRGTVAEYVNMHTLWPLVWTGGAFVAAMLAACALRRVSLAALRRWTQQSGRVQHSELLRAGMDAIEAPSRWWCAVVGLYVANEVALEFSLLPARWHGVLRLMFELVVIFSITVTVARVAGRLMGRAAEQRALGGSVTGLAQTSSRAAVFIVGVLVLLSTLGVQITPILTALGVGGLAVALALQDTLANLFAGIHLLADKSIRIGDHVKAGDAGEGSVIDIGWRSTRIRSLANNIIVVPNQTMARAAITNYDQPETRLAQGLKVGVDYSADPDHVEALLVDEVTRAVGQLPGLLRNPPPSVSLIPGFGEYSLDFTVGYHVEKFVDQFQVQSELRKRILRRLHREGLTVPVSVPTRVA